MSILQVATYHLNRPVMSSPFGNLKMEELMASKPIGTTASTGEICPESGIWSPQVTGGTTAPIAKGNRMPPYRGSAVTWKLIQLG